MNRLRLASWSEYTCMYFYMQVQLKAHNTVPCSSAFLTKGNNFSDFLFDFLDYDTHVPQKGVGAPVAQLVKRWPTDLAD